MVLVANDDDSAWVAYEAVPVRAPTNEPVNEELIEVAIIDPVTVKEPDTIKDPVTDWDPVKYWKLASNSCIVSADPLVCLYVNAMVKVYYKYYEDATKYSIWTDPVFALAIIEFKVLKLV